MTSDQLAGIAGIVLSIAFSFIPGLKDWYDKQTSQAKALVMLGLVVLTGAVVYGLSCAGFAEQLGIAVTCTQEGALGLIMAIIGVLVGNQSAYLVTRRMRG